jgi:hypothetical protein
VLVAGSIDENDAIGRMRFHDAAMKLPLADNFARMVHIGHAHENVRAEKFCGNARIESSDLSSVMSSSFPAPERVEFQKASRCAI